MTFQLRPYQSEAVGQTMAGFDLYDRQCIVLGTGGGKTEIFIRVAEEFYKKTGKAVLILSHLSILTTQTLKRFKLRAPTIRTGVLQANIRPYPLADVVVSTMQSSRNPEKADFLRNRMSKEIGLIIVDEAHFIPTDSYQKILSYYPSAKVLGVTATPYRQNKFMINYFENLAFNMSARELIKQGYLVPPKIYQIERTSNDLEKVIGQVISLYKQHETGKRAIIFMRSKEDCRALRDTAALYGLKGEVIVDETNERTREGIIESFSRGDTDFLVSCDVLTAGFDCPAVESIFMPYGTKSATTYLQRLGRGLRRCDEIGKKLCKMYVFGSGPELADGFYRRATNLSLNQENRIREYDTVLETCDLNFMDEVDERCERAVWNLKVKEAILCMQKYGYSNLAGNLNRRELPGWVMKDVLELLPDWRPIPRNTKVKATKNQTLFLKNRGIEAGSKDEASFLISCMKRDEPKDERWIIPDGTFKGRMIWETPHAYRGRIKEQFKESAVYPVVMAWEAHQKRRKA